MAYEKALNISLWIVKNPDINTTRLKGMAGLGVHTMWIRRHPQGVSDFLLP
jgi:hypothetical protein